jgi:hypothetical protein
MERREALRLLATAVTLPLIPRELYARLRAARAETQTGGLRTLDAHNNQLVVQLTEIILPETDTPGAKTARVNEFIDLILTEWCTDEERARFRAGLAGVDARCKTRFGKEFLTSSPEQQTEIVRDLDLEMASEQLALHSGDREARESGPPNFFSWLKELTLTGYYTSEAGATQELHFEIIPGLYKGCVPGGESQKSH